MHESSSPVSTAFLGKARDWCRFRRCLTSNATVLSDCCGNGTDLSVVGGVFIQILDFHLATSDSYLIPHHCLVTDNLLGEKE